MWIPFFHTTSFCVHSYFHVWRGRKRLPNHQWSPAPRRLITAPHITSSFNFQPFKVWFRNMLLSAVKVNCKQPIQHDMVPTTVQRKEGHDRTQSVSVIRQTLLKELSRLQSVTLPCNRWFHSDSFYSPKLVSHIGGHVFAGLRVSVAYMALMK